LSDRRAAGRWRASRKRPQALALPRLPVSPALEDLAWSRILPGFAVVAVLGALVLALNVRMIRN
jgi:hypothetical protein